MAYSISIDLPGKLELVGESLKIWMRNMTVQLRAEVEAEMTFKIQMAIGTDAGLLGCARWLGYPCWDKLITVKTKIDLGVSFGIHWNDNTGRIGISVSMKDTHVR